MIAIGAHHIEGRHIQKFHHIMGAEAMMIVIQTQCPCIGGALILTSPLHWNPFEVSSCFSEEIVPDLAHKKPNQLIDLIGTDEIEPDD